MATGGEYNTIPGLVAGADLSAAQFKVVKAASTGGAVVVGSAATDKCLGVLQNNPKNGEAAEVAFLGVCKALAEASVTYGARVTSSSTGRVKVTTTANDTVIGHSLGTASTSAGDLIPVLLSGLFNF